MSHYDFLTRKKFSKRISSINPHHVIIILSIVILLLVGVIYFILSNDKQQVVVSPSNHSFLPFDAALLSNSNPDKGVAVPLTDKELKAVMNSRLIEDHPNIPLTSDEVKNLLSK